MPPRAPRPSPKDYTGRQRAALAAEHAEEMQKRSGELSMFTAAEAAARNVPVVLDDRGNEVSVVADGVKDDGPLNVLPETMRVRMACDLPHVTIGQGTNFDFDENQLYELPRHVGEHLNALGYVAQIY